MNLRTPFTVIDGGLSTVLEEQGFDLRHPLWTARLITENPEALVEAHLAYLRAGAEVVITASYQASVDGFVAGGLSRAEAEAALRSTTALAREAVARHGSGALVAASVGPYGATLADGSEYHGDYAITDEALRQFHAERLALLAESAPDLLAIETIPSAREALALRDALEGNTLPAWFAFTCRDDARTASGDRIEDAIAIAASVPGVIAVGVNCTDPVFIGPLLERAASVTDLPLVAYGNAGQAWNAAAGVWEGTAAASFPVDRWVEAGARLIGGCCGVGPAGIAALRRSRD